MGRYFRLFIIVLASFYSSLSLASRTIVVEPSQLTRTWSQGQGAFAHSDSRNWSQPISTQSGSTSLAVSTRRSYSLATVGNGLKTLLKVNPYRAAGSAALALALASFEIEPDPSGNGYTRTTYSDPAPIPHPTSDCQVWSNCYSHWEVSGGRGMTPQAAWSAVNLREGYSHGPCVNLTSTSVRCYSLNSSGAQSSSSAGGWIAKSKGCPPGSSFQALGVSGCYVASQAPLSFSDPVWDDLATSFVPTASPQDLDLIFDYAPQNPDELIFTGPPSIDLPSVTTTSTNPITGDSTVTHTLPSIQFEYGTSPLSITQTPTSTTNTYQNGNLTNTSTTTTNNTSSSNVTQTAPKIEVPTDCAFMPTVCAFIEWVKEPNDQQEPDLSELVHDPDDFERNYTISGSSSCPAPVQISILGFTTELSYQPFCDFSVLLKPIIILFCLIGAIYISLGIKTGD